MGVYPEKRKPELIPAHYPPCLTVGGVLICRGAGRSMGVCPENRKPELTPAHDPPRLTVGGVFIRRSAGRSMGICPDIQGKLVVGQEDSCLYLLSTGGLGLPIA